jgi:hypothetical protein
MAENETAITLDDLLADAAQILSDGGLKSLARAVQIAQAQLSGDPPRGESYVRDICEALEATNDLGAEWDQERDEFTIEGQKIRRLANAMTKVETFGLEPESRLRNALREYVDTLCDLQALIEGAHTQRSLRSFSERKIDARIDAALERLGFEKANDDTPETTPTE